MAIGGAIGRAIRTAGRPGSDPFSPAAIAFYRGLQKKPTVRKPGWGQGISQVQRTNIAAASGNPEAEAELKRAALLRVAAQLQAQAKVKAQGGNPRTGEHARSPVRPEPNRTPGREATGRSSASMGPLAQGAERAQNLAAQRGAGVAPPAPPVIPPPTFGGPLMAPPKPGAKPPSPQAVAQLQAAIKQNQVNAWNWNAAASRNAENSRDPQAWVRAAAQAEGLTPDEVALVSRAVGKESSNSTDPGLTNTWDSNARQGTPSIGPAQVIQPTFNSYADPGWNIRNPVQNIRAAIRYAKAKYGARWAQAMAYGANPARGVTGY